MSDDQEDADDIEDEQPEIDNDEMADFSAVAEEIEGSAGDDDDQDENGDAEEASEQTKDAGSDPEMSFSSMDTTPGDVYCNGLGLAASVAKDNFGSGVEDMEDSVENYASMAKTTDVDEFVNEWMETRAGIDELSPGQGILIATAMFGMMVAVEDPQIAQGVAEKAQGVGS